MADTTGMADLRAENIEAAIKGFALKKYVFKQLCMINSSNSWKESYYKETSTELTAKGNENSIKGVPRLATFPTLEPSWTKTSSYLLKHGGEGTIAWEDAMSNEVDVIARTLIRIAKAVTASVDANIWDTITESRSVTNINSVTIAGGSEWNSATVANRDPLQDILNAAKAIAEDDYDPYINGYLLLNPKNYANLLGGQQVRNAGSFSEGVTSNGQAGKICGFKMLVSNNVTADYAAVVVGKIAATWKEAVPLTVVTITDPGISYKIRAWEVGVCQLVNPGAVCLIINTDA